MKRLLVSVLLLAALFLPSAGFAAPALDATPRIAVMSAYAPELVALLAATNDKQTHSVNGIDFTTGTLGGKKVVLVLSGISMVNAAMTTQMLVDRFDVQALLFSGVAGGVDAGLHIGDVAVPARWGQYLETHIVRQAADGSLAPVPWASLPYPPMGVFQPSNAYVRREGKAEPERKFWFAVDPTLLALAEKLVPTVTLDRCAANKTCLETTPKGVVGGNAVSGPAFMDNAAWRDYLSRTMQARVVDMETAAVALVAEQNHLPFIAFRSVSDLAGADPDTNRINTFLGLAANNAAKVLTAFLRSMPEIERKQ
jgi:adenosylhomocysteine nucleosidase